VIVTDTNILVYMLMPSEMTGLVEKLRHRDADWLVPRLWRSEMRNVLAQYMRRSLISVDRAIELMSLAQSRVAGREYEAISSDILRLVGQSACTAYDCEFVALAKRYGVKLVTMDRKIVSAFPETAVLLTDYV
jgi:predicted nucleic acid-binding protein